MTIGPKSLRVPPVRSREMSAVRPSAATDGQVNAGRPGGPRGEHRAAPAVAERPTGTRPRLRDAATICTAVLWVPPDGIRCERDAAHDGIKHRHGCTHWGPGKAVTP